MSSHDWPEHKPLGADPSPLEPRSNSVDPPNNSPEVAAFCKNILLGIAEDAQSLSKFTSQLAPMGADHPLRASKKFTFPDPIYLLKPGTTEFAITDGTFVCGWAQSSVVYRFVLYARSGASQGRNFRRRQGD